MKLLLEACANTEAATTVGYAGLMCLDARGVRMEASINGETALIRASRAGRAETVKLLLEARANTEAVTTDGDTALPLACVHPDIVRMLLDARASMEVSDHGETALIRASRADSPESVKLLLEARANTEAATTVGYAGLMCLDARGICMEASINGETALIRASRAGRAETVKLLLEARQHGGSNYRWRHGFTAGLCASRHCEDAAGCPSKHGGKQPRRDSSDSGISCRFSRKREIAARSPCQHGRGDLQVWRHRFDCSYLLLSD